MGYSTPDNLRRGYTGYEKDGESGLDFAQARYYNSTHGRFTSVDPLTASASIKNPQTFNRYSYVLNSPYKYTDPLGLLPSSWNTHYGGGGGFCSASQSSCEEGEELTTASIEAYQKKQQEQEKKRQEEKRKKQQVKKKQQAKRPTPPPRPAKKDGPKPVSATVQAESVGPNAVPKGGEFLVGSMAILTVSVVGDDGKPFEGTVTESVESKVNGEATGTVINRGSVQLVNGEMNDIVAPPGALTGDRMPTEAEVITMSDKTENTKMKIEQTATFTVSGPDTKATLTVVHKRTLTNVDATGELRPIKNGTRYVYYDRGTTVTQNSP